MQRMLARVQPDVVGVLVAYCLKLPTELKLSSASAVILMGKVTPCSVNFLDS